MLWIEDGTFPQKFIVIDLCLWVHRINTNTSRQLSTGFNKHNNFPQKELLTTNPEQWLDLRVTVLKAKCQIRGKGCRSLSVGKRQVGWWVKLQVVQVNAATAVPSPFPYTFACVCVWCLNSHRLYMVQRYHKHHHTRKRSDLCGRLFAPGRYKLAFLFHFDNDTFFMTVSEWIIFKDGTSKTG